MNPFERDYHPELCLGAPSAVPCGGPASCFSRFNSGGLILNCVIFHAPSASYARRIPPLSSFSLSPSWKIPGRLVTMTLASSRLTFHGDALPFGSPLWLLGMTQSIPISGPLSTPPFSFSHIHSPLASVVLGLSRPRFLCGFFCSSFIGSGLAVPPQWMTPPLACFPCRMRLTCVS